MPIKLPQEITYFYEITMMTDRLYYCIPQKQLHSMVKQGKVQENIIEDYPDGVDIKVSMIKFKELKECYGMSFNIEPQLIWKAFQFIKSKIKKKNFGTGFIKRQFLEDLAKQIQPDYDQEMTKPPEVDMEPIAFASQKRVQRKMRLSKKRLDIKLKQLSIKDINPKKSIIEQSFSRIKMSEGEDPFDFLSRYNQQLKGGK